MDLGISGRTAVVTGATRGIGAAVARILREEGATVVAVARSEGLDVTAPDAAERIAERAGGPVDILVNNAGTSRILSLDEVTDDDYYAAFELNVMAPMRLMRHFAPGMAERGWGRIVNVTSTAGKRPRRPGRPTPWPRPGSTRSRGCSPTAGRPRACSSTSSPRVPRPRRCGWTPAGSRTRWPERGGITRDEAVARHAEKVPIGRFGEEEEVAAVVAFLCSERASNVAGRRLVGRRRHLPVDDLATGQTGCGAASRATRAA